MRKFLGTDWLKRVQLQLALHYCEITITISRVILPFTCILNLSYFLKNVSLKFSLVHAYLQLHSKLLLLLYTITRAKRN